MATLSSHSATTQKPPSAVIERRPGHQRLGEIMVEHRGLTPNQVEEILVYQSEHRVRFGAAAVALKLASAKDVFWALAQQFGYSNYSPSNWRVNEELNGYLTFQRGG